MFNTKSFQSSQLFCENHPDSNLIEDHAAGDLICPECGLVIGERLIDVQAEWRTFSDRDVNSVDMCRVGQAQDPTLESEDLSTFTSAPITSTNFNGNEKKIFLNKETNKEKNYRLNIQEIRELGDRIKADKSIIDTAIKIYSDFFKINEKRIQKKNALVAACLYIACNMESVTRTFKEICGVTNCYEKEVTKYFNLIKNKLNINHKSTSANDLIARFCSRLNMPRSVMKIAEQLAIKINDISCLVSRRPTTIAAVCVYIAAEQTSNASNFKEISLISGASESSLRKLNILIKKQKELQLN